MRRAQIRGTRGQKARIKSVPSPVGGWNARDPIGSMKETDALKLDNFFCTPYDVLVRSGYSKYTTGFSNPVNTLAPYEPTSGASKLFAFSGGNIYDSSVTGAIGAPVVAGLLDSKCQTVTFGTSGGLFLVACNGEDLPMVYNGTVWSNLFAAAFTTTISTLTSVGTLATCTMTTDHNLKTGMSVTIAGCTPSAYNGTYVVTVTSTTAFTFVLSAALGVVTVLGTATPVINAAITGVDPKLLIQPVIFKSRLWFVEKDSSRIWYLPTLSLGGAAQSIDFAPLCNMGGYLMAMSDWSLDAGYGMDDYAVFITSNGQVVVFKGTDPASSATWSMVGVYDIGAPIGRRCMTKYAGDLTIMCQDGLMSMSKALMSTRVNSKEAFTDKIQHVISSYVTSYGANFGWHTTGFPRQNMLLLNVPTSSTTSYQLAMNTISGAWSQFTGWDATTFVLFNDELYFGGSTYVAHAWDTSADDGANIPFEAQQAFSYMGGGGQLKKLSMIRPLISTDGTPTLLLGVNTDFDQSSPTSVPSFTPSTYATWDNSTWDVGIWGGDLTLKKDWQTAFGLGYCFAAHIKGGIQGAALHWSATDFMLEDGGMV